MQTLEVRLGRRSYPIHIGAGILGRRRLLAEEIPARQVLIVSNDVVAPLYLKPLEEALADRDSHCVILPDGERSKTLDSFRRIIDVLIEKTFHRDACIVALGGGVVGDIAGFAAACYQRGIDYVQIPTTLLAQVDSSVGGKTAVNHPRAKNMIGAFHQPISVLIDTNVLRTLPSRELSAGLAEVIKYGLILDRSLFEWLEEHVEALVTLDSGALREAVRRCCEIKAAVVAEDERERGRRALLNLGHTFGHALESWGGFEKWLHGEAVAIGIALAARTSKGLGWLSEQDCARIERLLARAGLPAAAEGIGSGELLALMQLDKKAGAQGLRFVLLKGIGESVLTGAPPETVLRGVLGEALGG